MSLKPIEARFLTALRKGKVEGISKQLIDITPRELLKLSFNWFDFTDCPEEFLGIAKTDKIIMELVDTFFEYLATGDGHSKEVQPLKNFSPLELLNEFTFSLYDIGFRFRE